MAIKNSKNLYFPVFITTVLIGVGIVLVLSLYVSKLNHGLFELLQNIHEPIRKHTQNNLTSLPNQPIVYVYPDQYDSRIVFKDAILGIQNQGGCASCVIFVLLSLLSDQIAKESGKPAFALSAQYVLDSLENNLSFVNDMATLVRKDSTAEPGTSAPIVTTPPNVFLTGYGLCAGNFVPLLAYYLQPSQNTGTVTAECYPYKYDVPMTFYQPFLKRIRVILRYKIPVLVTLCILLSLLGFHMMFLLYSFRTPSSSLNTLSHFQMYFLMFYSLSIILLSLATWYALETYRLHDTLFALRNGHINAQSVNIDLASQISEKNFTCSVANPLSSEFEMSKIRCVDSNLPLTKYFIGSFVMISDPFVDDHSRFGFNLVSSKNFRWMNASDNYASKTVEQKIAFLKTQIQTYRSIGLSFQLPVSFYTFFSNEDYRPPYDIDIDPDTQKIIITGGHAVSIIGYTETAWIIRNQWGKNWGRYDDPGYIYWAFGALNFETDNSFYAVTYS